MVIVWLRVPAHGATLREGARDPGSPEHYGLQRAYTEPGGRPHDQQVSSAYPVVDECRAGSESRGHSDGRRRDPEPGDPPPQSEPLGRSNNEARDETPDQRRPGRIDSVHDQVRQITTDRKADQNRNRPDPQSTGSPAVVSGVRHFFSLCEWTYAAVAQSARVPLPQGIDRCIRLAVATSRRHTAGVPRDEHRAEGGRRADSCAWLTRQTATHSDAKSR